MSIRRTFHAEPTSEEAIRKSEATIAREAKNEEKNVKHVVKHLSAAEKEAQKVEKVIGTFSEDVA